MQNYRALPVTYAESDDEHIEQELSENIDKILDDIDSDGLDEFVENDFNTDYFNNTSFLNLVKKILSGKFFDEYTTLTDGIVGYFKQNFKQYFVFVFTIFAQIVLFEIFNNFCNDKFSDLKKVVKIIFSILVTLTILMYSKSLISLISITITKIFDYCKILFPILLGLILLSGSNGTYSVYNALSIFLLNTGSYVFVYVLLPLITCVIILSISSIIFQKNKFGKLISVLKSAFKYIIIAFFAIFGIFSSINIFSSGMSDGVNYRLTKFAIKSYIPVLGGYLSDGFDFVHTCSVLIKNSFGICGILILVFIVLKPILSCILYSFSLKILSVIVSFIGNNEYADYFEKVSSSISYLITILAGIFMCLFIFIYLIILSVSVLWCYMNLLLNLLS